MNFIQCNPVLFSAMLLGSLQGSLILLLQIFRRNRWNISLLLLPTALAVPLILKLSGYYIIGEQIYLCVSVMAWIFLKTFQFHRKKIIFTSAIGSYTWLGKMMLLNWIILLPFTLYLSSRPVAYSLTHTAIGLGLAGLSLLYEVIRPSLIKGKGWGIFSDTFHGGTSLYLWGLFIMISPQLMGTDWITLCGPILYTLLAVHPWRAFLTGDSRFLRAYGGSRHSNEAAWNSTLPYSECFQSEKSPPFDSLQDQENSGHTRIIPMPSRHHSDRIAGGRGFGI